ncbi:unnamed protein product [Mycena citricolor]|uniref:Cyclin N-terminal domain-containing protein n=1 Tax=Mycena citricolor TaxID=2018698 RepID=A0AAD2H7G8_9AGAR|nr:unnamed protein product [Mycena citricolor]
MSDYSSWSPVSSSSSSGSSRSSPVHSASLVDPISHSPAMMQLIETEISHSFIDYIVERVADTVYYALGRDNASYRTTPARQSKYAAKFANFVSTIVSRAEVTPSTLLVALVYIARARPHLSIALEDWAFERVFLGALIVASKFTQDSTLKNVHWALCTGVFGKGDIGRIEREFLEVLDWELNVREDEIVAHWGGIMAALNVVDTDMDIELVPSLSKRAHHRHESPTRVVPELEASSPTSTCVSLSPRTPFTSRPSSPVYHDEAESSHMEVDADKSELESPAVAAGKSLPVACKLATKMRDMFHPVRHSRPVMVD